MQTEIYQTAKLLSENPYTVDTVFFGGGTPSILAPGHVKALADTLRESFPFAENAEITIECNPGTLDEEKAAVYRQAGINRISFGLQSANNRELKMLGRIHTMEEFVQSYETARAAGFDNINMDTIAGLPGESAESFCRTIRILTGLEPESITVHTLALKRSSRFNHEEDPTVLVAQEAEKMVQFTMEELPAAGYFPYYLYRQSRMLSNLENIGWAKPGFESLYNVYIMEETHSILACGAGAVTKLRQPGGEYIERIFNFKFPYEYNSRFEEMMKRKEQVLRFYEQYQ